MKWGNGRACHILLIDSKPAILWSARMKIGNAIKTLHLVQAPRALTNATLPANNIAGGNLLGALPL